MKSIYELELHEATEIKPGERITRVPGGWNYLYGNEDGIAVQFVPYSDEFNPKKVKK